VVRFAAVLSADAVHGLRRTGVNSVAMDLEEQTLERAGDRCEECGAKLTPREMEAVLESGGPVLCTIHAEEIVPVGEDEAEFGVGD
jgi:uncharacterized protein with PIN domain